MINHEVVDALGHALEMFIFSQPRINITTPPQPYTWKMGYRTSCPLPRLETATLVAMSHHRYRRVGLLNQSKIPRTRKMILLLSGSFDRAWHRKYSGLFEGF